MAENHWEKLGVPRGSAVRFPSMAKRLLRRHCGFYHCKCKHQDPRSSSGQTIQRTYTSRASCYRLMATTDSLAKGSHG
jgi:hypothetical protein